MEIKRKTIIHDEEYLRQVSKLIDFTREDYKQDLQILSKFCNDNECFALAAVQVGIPKRMIYLKNTTLDVPLDDPSYNEAKILINPMVKSRKGHTKFWEACLSCLDNMGLVIRPYEIELDYFDEKGILQNQTFKGFESTVISHELDHLDGILHMDIAEEIIVMPEEERKAYREKHPYEILSEACVFDSTAYKTLKK